MSKIKISVVGCGYWGKNLVRNFAELGVLESVCDTNEKLSSDTSNLYNVPCLAFDMVLKSDVDGIVIASPASQHSDLARQALLAGKHVFVEKPLAINLEEAKELCQIAKDTGKKLMVGHLLQYHPAYLELKKLVTSDKLGKIQYIYSNRLSFGKIRTEENVLWSFSPHDISMILGLVGELPEMVNATGSAFISKGIDDIATAHLVFKNDIKAHISVSWLHPYKEQKITVIGTKAMAVFDDCLPWESKLQLYDHKIKWLNGVPFSQKGDSTNVPCSEAEPLKNECIHFINSIATNADPITCGEEGLRVLKVLSAAQISMDTGKMINIEEKKKKDDFFIHETAIIDTGCEIGSETKIWHFSHIIKGTKIGSKCIVGQNVMIGPDVVIGDRCKIQNNVSIYKGVVLEDGVFCGPSCVFTNVNNPRSEIERKDEFRKTYVKKGATIGANATIVCGVELGEYSFIGAGAVVTKNVKPHALVVGNPAHQIGWMSHSGNKLGKDLVCPFDGKKYRLTDSDNLVEIKD